MWECVSVVGVKVVGKGLIERQSVGEKAAETKKVAEELNCHRRR